MEDSQEKKLVNQLQRPGEALLVTDFAGTQHVAMPYCTQTDMERVARQIGEQRSGLTLRSEVLQEQLPATPDVAEASRTTSDTAPRGVLILTENQKQSGSGVPVEGDREAETLTIEFLCEKLDAGWKQREIERRTGINQSKISKFKNGNKEALNAGEKRVIFELLIFGASF